MLFKDSKWFLPLQTFSPFIIVIIVELTFGNELFLNSQKQLCYAKMVKLFPNIKIQTIILI